MSGLVRYEVADGIALLTLNRPEQRNAVNAALAADLRAVLARFEADSPRLICHIVIWASDIS